MKRIVRSLIFLAIVFFLVSGSYGKTVSVSGSGSQGGGFVSIDIAASKDSSVNGNVVVSGGTVTPSISTKGRVQRFEVTHQVTDSTGKHAEVYAKVVNGQNIQYSSKVQPREGKLKDAYDWVSAEEWLSVGAADYIACTESASYPASSLTARAGIDMPFGGTLTGYYGMAYASATQALSTEQVPSASGPKITVTGRETNSENTFGLVTDLTGRPAMFSGTVTSDTTANKVTQDIQTASGQTVSLEDSRKIGANQQKVTLNSKDGTFSGLATSYNSGHIIQDIVNLAESGDSLDVGAGRYKENIVIDKGGLLSIIGVGKDRTIVDGGAAGSVFTIANKYQTPVGSTITLSGITITNGNVGIDATGTTLNLNDVMITGNAYSGIATQLGGPVTMNGHSSIADNTGIGISVDKGSSVIMNDHSSITGNTGGGIGGWYSQVTMNDHSSISGNRADYGGGIYLVYGDVTMNDHSSITNNAAVNIGGGIYIAHPNGGWVNMNGYSSIAGNTAANGGGIYIANGDSVNMNGHSSIAGNTAATGGGIYNRGTVNMNGRSSITYNTATSDGGGIYNTQGTINFLDSQGNIIPGYDPKNNDYLHFFGPTINGPDNKPNDVAP